MSPRTNIAVPHVWSVALPARGEYTGAGVINGVDYGNNMLFGRANLTPGMGNLVSAVFQPGGTFMGLPFTYGWTGFTIEETHDAGIWGSMFIRNNVFLDNPVDLSADFYNALINKTSFYGATGEGYGAYVIRPQALPIYPYAYAGSGHTHADVLAGPQNITIVWTYDLGKDHPTHWAIATTSNGPYERGAYGLEGNVRYAFSIEASNNRYDWDQILGGYAIYQQGKGALPSGCRHYRYWRLKFYWWLDGSEYENWANLFFGSTPPVGLQFQPLAVAFSLGAFQRTKNEVYEGWGREYIYVNDDGTFLTTGHPTRDSIMVYNATNGRLLMPWVDYKPASADTSHYQMITHKELWSNCLSLLVVYNNKARSTEVPISATRVNATNRKTLPRKGAPPL